MAFFTLSFKIKSILTQFFIHIKFNNKVVGTQLSEQEMNRLEDI